MPDDPKTYRIAKVTDFLDVPMDRLRDCLEEFVIWLSMFHAARMALGGAIKGIPESYDWIDDGKAEMRLVGIDAETGERTELLSTTMSEIRGRQTDA
jgi:hypothetical protein